MICSIKKIIIRKINSIFLTIVFFMEQEGLGPQLVIYSGKRSLLQSKKEKKKNYNRLSSHSVILGKDFFFARWITIANSYLKMFLQLSTETCCCLKIALFLVVQNMWNGNISPR